MPIPSQTQETCPKCGWKNKHINTSDCIVFFERECPVCHSETQLVILENPLHPKGSIFNTLKNLFK